MIILTREIGQWLDIGNRIRVQIVDIKGDKVRIGIKAPLEIPIVRDDAKDKTPKVRKGAA